MKGLQGKNALITGAASGIGRAIAIRLAQEGCAVAINYRSDRAEAEETQDQAMQAACQDIEACGGRSLVVHGDMAQADDIVNLVNTVITKFGQLDILVNNAGIQLEQASHEVSTEDLDRVLAINLRGAFLCARETLKHFIARDYPGVIINVSSVHEIIPRPHYVSYAMSKGGMGNLTRTLALEYAERGIRVNAIAPGATATPINDEWTEDAQKQAQVASFIPMRRVGQPEEMAAIAAFLASDEAAYITGQTLYIDGGLTLYPSFQTPWSS